MSFRMIDHQTSLKKENLNSNLYTLSLLSESFRLGLANQQTITGIQEQIFFILKDLIMRYTKGESSSVKTETAERILNSIYYSLDAYLESFNNPEDGLAVLKTKSIRELYEKGIELVTSCVAATRKLYREIAARKLEVPLAVYNDAIDQDLPEFFQTYNVMFGAHETMCSADYPLVFDDMNARGIYYIKQYLEKLDTETLFCSRFRKEDITGILGDYGRICRIDYRESPFNLFEVLINNAIFSVLSGNHADRLALSPSQAELLESKFRDLNTSEIKSQINAAIEKVIKGLGIDQPRLVNYIHQYNTLFCGRIVNAVKNGSLRNIIITEINQDRQDGKMIFADGKKMSDVSFRQLFKRITECEDVAEKINLIKLKVRSFEDFLDVLNGDCLFGSEFSALFNTLSDLELAGLGRMVFFETLRDGQLDLSTVLIREMKTETEWQRQYIQFIQGLDEDRVKKIGELVNLIVGNPMEF